MSTKAGATFALIKETEWKYSVSEIFIHLHAVNEPQQQKWEDGFSATFEQKDNYNNILHFTKNINAITFSAPYSKKRMAAEIQSQPHATVLDYNQFSSQNQRKTISRGVLTHQLYKIDYLLRETI